MRKRHVKVVTSIIQSKGNCEELVGNICHDCPFYNKCEGYNYDWFVHEIRLHDAMDYMKKEFTTEEVFEALL